MSSDSDEAAPVVEDDRRTMALTLLSKGVSSKLRVVYDKSRSATCCLCNSKSTDDSPLDGWEGDEDRLLGGKLPWGKYRKIELEDGEMARIPEGKIDLICMNVYRALGSWEGGPGPGFCSSRQLATGVRLG